MTTLRRDKILIVDDEPSNIWALIKNLETDYEIVSATNGEKALSMALTTAPDLILLDVSMPGMNGYEVCERLKANKMTKDIPVIFLTANLDEISETKGLALGASDYIKKPFSLLVVRARVKSVLHLKKEMDRRALLQLHLAEINDRLESSIKQKRSELNELQTTLHNYEDKYNRLFPLKPVTKERPAILVVDDTPENIHILSKSLEEDYEIYCAASGEKALQIAFSDNPPDLFLLDIMMPDMDGYELCSRLKANLETRDIPVIFVTAMSQEFDETKGLNLGAMDYITKPFSIPVVNARVATALKLKESMDHRNALTQELERLNFELEKKVRDNTQALEQTQDALTFSEAKYRTIFENAIEGIFQSTSAGEILNVNPALAHILGYESALELLEQVSSAEQLYVKLADRDKFRALLERDGYVNGFETKFKRQNGVHVWVSLSAKEISNESGVKHYQGFLTDITARKKAQQGLETLNHELELRVKERTGELELSLSHLQMFQTQLVESEKLASLGNLLVGMAHEINTPLGVILTALSYLQDEFSAVNFHRPASEASQQEVDLFLNNFNEALRLCLMNVDRIIELVNVFKELAIDTTESTKTAFDLVEHIQLIVNSFADRLKRRGLRCDLVAPNELNINSHRNIFNTILRHLFENSMQHGFQNASAGTIRIRLELQDNQIILDYQDDGVGISEEIQDKIFDPFFTTARNEGRAGLGMHIICNLVNQALKGQIRCLPEPGGAKFRMTFPLKP